MRFALLTAIALFLVDRLDAAEGQRLQSLQLASLGEIHPVAISPDSRRIAVAFSNRSSTQERLRGPVYAKEIARDLDKYPREIGIGVWTIENSEFTHWLPTETTAYTVHFSPNGGKLVSVSTNSGMQIWDLSSGERSEMKIAVDGNKMGDPCGSFVFLDDGDRVAVLQTHGVSIHSFPAGKLLAKCKDRFLIDVPHVAASADGKRVSANCRVWEVDTGKLVASLDRPDSVRHTVFAPNRDLLVGFAFMRPNAATLWDTRNNRLYPLFKRGRENGGEQWELECIALSPSGRYIATGGDDGKICLWSTSAKSLEAIIEISPRIVRGRDLSWGAQELPQTVQFSQDGKLLVVSYPYTVEIVDVDMLTRKAELQKPCHLGCCWVGDKQILEEITEPDPVPPSNRWVEAESAIKPGDILLARMEHSRSWRRARVVYVPDDKKVNVHFVGWSPQYQITLPRSQLQFP